MQTIAKRDARCSRQRCAPWLGHALHIPAEDENRLDLPDAQERRQYKEKRRQEGQSEPLRNRYPLKLDIRGDREEPGDQQRECLLHPGAEEDPNTPAGQRQEDRLQEIDLQNLGRTAPERLHHRDRIELLLQVGLHCHRHAESAHHESNQADKAQKGGRVAQPPGDQRMRLAVIGDHRFRESHRQLFPRLQDHLVGAARRELEKKALRTAAAFLQQACPLQVGPGQHHAGSHVH